MNIEDNKVKVMAYIAMFAAMQIVLEFLTKFTEMPNGGTIAFSLVPIFIASYLLGAKNGIICALVSLGIQFVSGLAKYYGVASLLLDYIIPMILVGGVSIIPLVKIKDVDVPIGIIIVCILKFICHMFSGAIAFATPLKANFAYNLPYNLGTLIACFILFIMLYPTVKKIFRLN